MKCLSSIAVMLVACVVLGAPKVFASQADTTQKGLKTVGEKKEEVPSLFQKENQKAKESKPSLQSKEKERNFPSCLSNSYYTVGEQYDKCGNKAKGESFKKMAKEKDPNCEVETIYGDKIIVKPFKDIQKKELLGEAYEDMSTDKTVGSPNKLLDSETQRKIVQGQFSRFLRAMLANNLPLLDKLMAAVIKVNEQELEKGDLLAAFDHVFSQVDFKNLCLKDLYVDDISKVEVVCDDTGGLIQVEAIEREDLKSLPFWKKHQKFHFKLIGREWVLAKIEAYS